MLSVQWQISATKVLLSYYSTYKDHSWIFCCWSLTHVWLFATPWNAAHQSSLSFTISQVSSNSCPLSESVMPSNHLILCHPLLLPSIFLSIRVFSNQSALPIKWPKYWSFSQASVLPMNIQGWFPLGLTDLISLLSKGLSRVFFSKIHNSKASIIRSSAFFMVQLSHPYMTTGKITVLTIQTFVREVISLLFNTLFRFVIGILPRSKHLLISWLQSLPQWFWNPRK